MKEIKVGLNIGRHDLETKLRTVAKNLEKQARIKFSMQLKGREITKQVEALNVFQTIITGLGDSAKMVQTPLIDGRRIYMVVDPK